MGEGDFATYITAIIDFHPCRRRMSTVIHKANRANVPIKMAERIVRASGGVYPEDVDMLLILAKTLSCYFLRPGPSWELRNERD